MRRSAVRRLLQRRLAEQVESWPPTVREELAGYFRPTDRDRPAASGRTRDPFWLLLPRWLWSDPRFIRVVANTGPALLADILWAQYCLFLFLRLHDDVVDDPATPRSLVLLADATLMESERTFAQHLDRGVFWTLFRASVQTSIRAILEVDALQRSPGGMKLEATRLYAEVDAIFRVGAAALCIKAGKANLLPGLFSLGDELAIAGQIIDDVEDIDEDLGRGRFNFAATRLEIDSPRRTAETAARLTRRVLVEDGIGVLAADVERHLDRAARATTSIGLSPAAAYVQKLRRELEKFKKALHRTRAEQLIGSCLSMYQARASA